MARITGFSRNEASARWWKAPELSEIAPGMDENVSRQNQRRAHTTDAIT